MKTLQRQQSERAAHAQVSPGVYVHACNLYGMQVTYVRWDTDPVGSQARWCWSGGGGWEGGEKRCSLQSRSGTFMVTSRPPPPPSLMVPDRGNGRLLGGRFAPAAGFPPKIGERIDNKRGAAERTRWCTYFIRCAYYTRKWRIGPCNPAIDFLPRRCK